MLSIEGFDLLVTNADASLLGRAPVSVVYPDTSDLRVAADVNKNVIAQEVGKAANIYAIWSRKNDNENWKVMYIGQRTKNKVIERIEQHFFYTPSGTQSKLEEVKRLVQDGKQIGLTTIFVYPDPMRLSIEDQIIFRKTNSEDDLPWNKKSRNVSLPRA